jgi:hypothetical protein
MHVTLGAALVLGAALAVSDCTSPTASPDLAQTSNATVFVSDTATPFPGFTVAFRASCGNLTCKFTNLSTSPTPILVERWDYGDGHAQTGNAHSERYPVAGSYVVHLQETATAPDGRVLMGTATATVVLE